MFFLSVFNHAHVCILTFIRTSAPTPQDILNGCIKYVTLSETACWTLLVSATSYRHFCLKSLCLTCHTLAMSLLNIMSFIHLVDNFLHLNQVQWEQNFAVNSISEQINISVQTSVCVCKVLVCLLCNFCIFSNCSLSFKI